MRWGAGMRWGAAMRRAVGSCRGVAICRGNGGNGGGTTDAGALGLGLARFAIDLIPHRMAKIANAASLIKASVS